MSHIAARNAATVPRSLVLALALLPLAGGSLASSPDDYPARRPRPAKAATSEAPKWDVLAPPGPRRTIPIDVDSGTWMSVDVSPAGDAIVFDLLGDIYLLPIEGGVAEPLREGLSWDMQPRFSPDGSRIAFTSDAQGGDNLWIMNRDGGDAYAVTQEDFRLVNSPVWMPDGRHLAVRKHFSSERSLGTGEIWLYHASGGKGTPMTKKTNDQKDLGEPAFSPDGRYLYYSEDTTSGRLFQYNKDPHAGIYSIQRLSLEDGRIETFLEGPGGACRPTPSPDGRSLAYVRRIGLKSVVIVHDLVSGEERLAFDRLDRDLQETWAIHGVYPAFAWTPDSRAIVLWAEGKLFRVDVGSGAVRDIPFRVRATREAREALRFPVEVAPDRFHTRMLRWVSVAPRGDSVVYQTLGKLYRRALPDGVPERLTRDAAAAPAPGFELYPSFTRDGKEIVYTTFSDAALGSIRWVDAAGGESRAFSLPPGHYVEPVVSPDGESLVFRKVGADSLRSRRYTHDTGLYVVARAAVASPSAEARAPRLLSREGFDAHFGAGSDRVYFTEIESSASDGDEKRFRVLKSIGLDRSEERRHARSEMAVALRVSPDDRWLAFQEQFQAYLTPLPATGRILELGPKSEALPVRRLSRDAGEYLHWSGDGGQLHWSLGAELFTVAIDPLIAPHAAPPAAAKADAKSTAGYEPPARGIDIGFDALADKPKGSVAFVGGRVVTMRGDEVIEDGVVVVEGNRILAVGPRSSTSLPSGAHVVDATGMSLLPGIVDVHYHGPQGSDGILPERNWSLHAALAFGVTTAHDPSHDTDSFFAAAELQRAGLIEGPRLFSTGTILYGAKAPFKAVIESLDDARSHLRRLKAVGAFSVKSYNQPRRDQRQQVIAAARELSMMVVPEGGSLYHHNMTMVVDGHTGVEHSLPIGAGYADVLALWGKTQVHYTPTLGVGYGGLFGENYWYQERDVFAHPRLSRFVPSQLLDARARRRMTASEGDWNHVRIARLAKQLQDAGVAVNVGAHGQREGLAAHWEIWMLVQGGMTPHQALRAATLNGARYLGLDRDLGSLEPGKLADLIVIDGDPLRDVRASERVLYTMRNGRLFAADTLDEIGNHPRRRQRFYWEAEALR